MYLQAAVHRKVLMVCLVLALAASGCSKDSSSDADALRSKVADLEKKLADLDPSSTSSLTSTTVAPTTVAVSTTVVPTTPPAPPPTTAPDPFGGLISAMPVGEAGEFADWKFPLPGPSTVVVEAEPNEEGPYSSEYFTAKIDDPGVSFDEVQAYLRTVPAQQGWDGSFEPTIGGESSHDIGYWHFLSRDGLFITINMYDEPGAQGDIAPLMIVDFTYADG